MRYHLSSGHWGMLRKDTGFFGAGAVGPHKRPHVGFVSFRLTRNTMISSCRAHLQLQMDCLGIRILPARSPEGRPETANPGCKGCRIKHPQNGNASKNKRGCISGGTSHSKTDPCEPGVKLLAKGFNRAYMRVSKKKGPQN